MNAFPIRITGPNGNFDLLDGHMRLRLLIEMGQVPEAIDANSGKRYLIEQKGESLVATEVSVH